MNKLINKKLTVNVGGVLVGGENPIIVQSMTNTNTADYLKTAIQIAELHKAGSELVRITINNKEAAESVIKIKQHLEKMGLNVPLIGDFHYNGHKLLEESPSCAKILDKYRINPGNVGSKSKKDLNFTKIIEQAIKYNKPIRIGANWGSIDQQILAKLMDENSNKENPLSNKELIYKTLIKSVLESAELAEKVGLPANKIILSVKMSKVQDLISVYRSLNKLCNYPLHLGLTEAGMGTKGVVASTAALSILLQEQIGNTIRVSITPEPNSSRTKEVLVTQEILQSMQLRNFSPEVVSCPGCGRTSSDYFLHLTKDIKGFLNKQMQTWKQTHPKSCNMTVAVMGCVVNGPGESKAANIGISLPGDGERPVAPVYVDGEHIKTLKGDFIYEDFIQIIKDYVEVNYLAK